MLVAAPEVGGADLEDDVAAVAVVRDSAPSPVFCRQSAIAAPLLSASMALPDSEPKLMPEMLTTEAGGRRAYDRADAPITLALGRAISSCACGIVAAPGPVKVRCLMIGVAADVLDVVVGAEAEVVVLQLGAGVDPPALVTAEGPLLVVARDDVLAQLGTEPLEEEARVAHDREVADDRVLRWTRSCTAVAAAAAAVPPRIAYLHLMATFLVLGRGNVEHPSGREAQASSPRARLTPEWVGSPSSGSTEMSTIR